MGYDITFHPVSEKELRYYFFDVVENHDLAEVRAHELAKSEYDYEWLLGIYNNFPDWLHSQEEIEPTFAYAAAAVAGFIHPYWYLRGQALTFLDTKHPIVSLFVPLTELGGPKLASLGPEATIISRNYSASGYLPHNRLDELQQLLSESDVEVSEIFSERGKESLQVTIKYAKENGLGFIEASDICTIDGESATYEPNLRNHGFSDLGDR